MRRAEWSSEPNQNTSFGKILVTGGLGFIGSRFVTHSLQQNTAAGVVILDSLTYAADHRRLAPLPAGHSPAFVRGDIRSAKDVRKAMSGCDCVVHLAAETHAPRAHADPELFFDVNSTGTENLLRIALEEGVKHFVHVSTDEVYGPVTDFVDETAPMRPISPYAHSKALAEEAVMQAAQNGLQTSILRPALTVGAGQHAEKLLPGYVMKALQGRRLTIEGSGCQDRIFLPATDLAAAIGLVLTRKSGGRLGIFNVSGDEQLSALELAEMVFEVTGRRTGLHFVRERQQTNKSCRTSDAKLRALGYRQTSSVRAELRGICETFRSRARQQPPHLRLDA